MIKPYEIEQYISKAARNYRMLSSPLNVLTYFKNNFKNGKR